MLLRAGVVCLLFSTVFALYSDNALRCQLFGISYNDCFGSVYRPIPVYDAYVKSFNLPVRKDPDCSYGMCRIAVVGTGMNRFVNITDKLHPPGNCVCVGNSSCGCEVVPVLDNPYPIQEFPKQEPETRTVTRVVDKTKTVTVQITPSLDIDDIVNKIPISLLDTELTTETQTHRDILHELDKKIEILQQSQNSILKGSPGLIHTISPSHTVPSSKPPIQIHSSGNVITIPYSTVTRTISVTVPEYMTTVRTQYLINTVDNYITETKTKTTTKTMTKTDTEIVTKTQTETISDHVERTKFSTVYVPKTVTLDKVSTVVKYDKKTVTVTKTRVIKPTPPKVPEIRPPREKEEKKRKPKIRIGINPQSSIIPEGKPGGYFLVKKTLSNKMICKDICTNPGKSLSGDCPVGMMAVCPPAQIVQGFNKPVENTAPSHEECGIKNDCTEVIKTVYVRASATPAVKQ